MSTLDRFSLRTRLVVGTALLVAIGLVVAGVAATSALRSYQLDRVDRQLTAAADSPALRDDGGRDGVGPGGRRRPPPRLPGELYRALLDGSGALVVESSSGEAPELPRLTPGEARARDLRPFTVDSGAGGEGQWRVIAVPVQGAGADGTVVLASDLGLVDETVERLVLLQLVIGAVVLTGITAAGLVLVRSSLSGLVEVERAASAVAAGQLDSRVPERHPATEVGRLASAFNRMVSHLQGAFAARDASDQRLRRFVADASHELRTPLTSIRGFAELYRQGAVADADVARLLRRIEDEATRMGVLVEDLLALARLDEQRPLHLEDVDLAVLCADAVHDARAVQPARPLTLEVAGPLLVRGDEARLRQVLSNLLSNALQHTPGDTRVTVRLRTEGEESAVVEVVDDGPGMAPETAERVFERFYRADTSRTRASGGSGLGLSIVASLVEAHGGRAELDSAPGRGSTFRVVLPRSAGR